MSFYRRVKYFLVHTLMLSNKDAQQLINTGAVEIDGEKITNNCLLAEHSEIKVNGRIERARKDFVYLKFHKPPGFESSLNEAIADNISVFFKGYENLAIAGRLDKQSEGLMLLSNDGKWVEQLCNPKFEKEKEYRVTLDKVPDNVFFASFQQGVIIGGYLTAPCICEPVLDHDIHIVLKEGKNRQIRRMCKVLGYTVLKLKRTRIAGSFLEDLEPGDKALFSPDNVTN